MHFFLSSFIFLLSITLLISYLPCSVSQPDESQAEEAQTEEPPPPPILECNKTKFLFDHTPFYLNSTLLEGAPPGSYPPNIYCSWDFIGSAECTAEISCSAFQIQKSQEQNCGRDEYFEVSDGTGGLEKFCGNSGPKDTLKPSKGLRDLYITFKSAEQLSNLKGFECVVQCSKKSAKELQITVSRVEDPTCGCGATNWKPPKRRKRVVQGPKAPTNEFPWQVAIVKPGTKKGFCGGSIINERYILTAAHCFAVHRLSKEDAEVLVYATYLDPTNREELIDRIPPLAAIEEFKKKLKKLEEKTKALKAVKAANVEDVKKSKTGSKVTGVTKKKESKKNNDEDKPLLPVGLGRRKKRSDEESVITGTQEEPAEEDSSYKKTEEEGQVRFSDSEHTVQRFKVIKMVYHPLFSKGYDFDVAVLKLDRKIVLSLDPENNPQAVCLPKLVYDHNYVGKVPYVSGWGLENENDTKTTGILRLLDVPVIPSEMCQNWTKYEISPRMICSGYEKGQRDACTGDSGGPLSLKTSTGVWEQIGIVSWGEGCARPKKPGVYARVAELQQWVYRHALEDSTWCKNNHA